MTLADKCNAAGILLTGLGSTLAMFGIYKQANGYFAFKPQDFFSEIYRIARTFITRGPAASRRQLGIAAKLGEVRGEDRVQSLIGFYCVFFGFLLQMAGSALLFAALFENGPTGIGHE